MEAAFFMPSSSYSQPTEPDSQHAELSAAMDAAQRKRCPAPTFREA
jgi:hypothetical protein